MAKDNTFKGFFLDELRDLYDAENQLIKALPKMAESAVSEKLRSGFEHHLQQTKNHARRIEQIMEAFGESPKGKKCKGMNGIVNEGKEVMEEDFEGEVHDAALISQAQRVEHYEIAGYGSARTYAQLLGESQAAALLQQTLDEEKETNDKLTQLAQEINPEAVRESKTQVRAKASGM